VSAVAVRPAVRISGLTHRYGERIALSGINLEVPPGELFGILGPNGAGKTTLFLILSTLLHPTAGTAEIAGADLRNETALVRRRIGVVFQSGSLDRKLTVEENLHHAGHLHGLSGPALAARIERLLGIVDLADRRRSRVETLSGGMRRRLDIARGILHEPPVLLLDEPTTGLDPGARADVWSHLGSLRASGVTLLVTTHALDEAERCDRIAIFDRGRVAALGRPDDLRGAIGGDVILLEGENAIALAEEVRKRLGVESRVTDGTVRIELERAHEFIPRLVEGLPGRIRSLTMRKPTLEDVFAKATGRRFREEEDA
jgi:ABC-2 type transport system ATP-binding protein